MSELMHDPFDTRKDSSQRDRERGEKAVEEMTKDLGSIYNPYALNKEQAEKLIAMGWRKQCIAEAFLVDISGRIK